MSLTALLLSLLQNAALLITMVIIYQLISSTIAPQSPLRQLYSGIATGLIGVLLMVAPVQYSPGVFIDARPVILGLSGLFYGLVPTVIAMGIMSAARFFTSDVAVWQAISVIFIAGCFGLLWRQYRSGPILEISRKELYLFGLAQCTIIVSFFLLSSDEFTADIARRIAIPILFILPPTTLLVGMLHLYIIQRGLMDITLKQTQEKLNIFRELIDHVHDSIMVYAPYSGQLLDVNETTCVLLGYSREELMQMTIQDINPEIDMSTHDERLAVLKEKEFENLESTHRRKDGSTFPVEVHLKYVHLDREYIVAAVRDITQRKQAEEVIWKQANFDSLTGLPNRRMFNDRLQQEIKKAERHSNKLALMFLDLDHFKEINDSLGHEMGDLLLQETAARIQQCLRKSDCVGRLGGDEFIVVLGELKEGTHAANVAQKVLTALMEPFNLNGNIVHVTTSIGITLYPDDAKGADDLMRKADQAMYEAKKHGRNCYRYFTPLMQEAVSRRMQLTNDLRLALSLGQLQLLYQPIVKLDVGSIEKAEALLRWEHPTAGNIPPDEFIVIAEETGLIHEIGDWAFRTVVEQLGHLRRLNPDFQVSVNKSPAQFRNHSCIEKWINLLREKEIPGRNVVIEITETLLLDSKPDIRLQLRTYHEAGILIALDDFGTGYSSLSYLNKFDIDYLKIDKSFIASLSPNNQDMVLSAAIINMGHQLGMEVIAEGVETREQHDLLVDAGCDFAQGFLFSRACTAEELKKIMTRKG